MPDDEAPQMSAKKVRKRFSKKKKVIVSIAAVVLLLSIGFGTYLILTGISGQKVSLEDRALILSMEGKYDKAIQLYDEELKKTTDESEITNLLNAKAGALFNDKQYEAALSIAQELYDENKNEPFASFLAQIYEKKGEKAKAIEYYQRAKELIDKKYQNVEEMTAYYQFKIDELNGAN